MSVTPVEMAAPTPSPLAPSPLAGASIAPAHVRARPRRAASLGSWARRRWWLLAGVGVLAVGGALALTQKGKAPTGAPAPEADGKAAVVALSVTVAPVELHEITRTLLVTGSLAARDELPIGTETSGLAIAEVPVDIGDHVKKGQLLARFNDSVLKADLAQRKAEVIEAEGNLVEAEANLRRAEELSRTGAMSGRDLDNRRALAISMRSRVEVAKANSDLALAKLKQSEIRAPADGTITARTARLGAVASAGGTELFRMIRDDQVELVADVPEGDLPLLKAGQKVGLSVDGGRASGQRFGAVVRLVEPTVDPKTRIGHVRIDIDRNAALKPGMFVTGDVAVGSQTLPTVPEAALVYRDVRPMVFVIDDANQVQARVVSPGGRQNGRVALLSGVSLGERVAVSGAGYLKQGDTVTVSQATVEGLKPLPSQP